MNKCKSILSLLVILALLLGCGDQSTDDTYQYGVLKSDPPMPPLTYTWSHPDCPFTADFPAEPEEEVIEQEDEIKSIIAQHSENGYGLQLNCDLNRLRSIEPVSFTVTEEYIGMLTNNDIIENVIIIGPSNSNFSGTQSFIRQYTNYLAGDINLQSNSLIYQYEKTLMVLTYLYPSEINKNLNGAEFFESVELKDD